MNNIIQGCYDRAFQVVSGFRTVRDQQARDVLTVVAECTKLETAVALRDKQLSELSALVNNLRQELARKEPRISSEQFGKLLEDILGGKPQ